MEQKYQNAKIVDKSSYLKYIVINMNRSQIELRGKCDWINFTCPECGNECEAYQGTISDYALLCPNVICKNFTRIAHISDQTDAIHDDDYK